MTSSEDLDMRKWLGAVVCALMGSGCFSPVDVSLGHLDAGSSGGGATGGGTGGGAAATGGGSASDGGLEPLTCVPNEWCWQHPLPQGQPLNSVFAASATEAWAVGEAGAMLRLLNGTWTAMKPVTNFSLRSLSGSGPNDVWAIGQRQDAYQLLHFDGARWAVEPHGALPVVLDVNASASGETWLMTVGRASSKVVLQRWNGATFVDAPALPAGLEAKSMCVRSASEVWVTVGDALNSFPFALYAWDGVAWSLVHRVPSSSSRFDSPIACPADGVAVAKVFDFDTSTMSFLEVRDRRLSFSAAAPSSMPLILSPHGDAFRVEGQAVSQWTQTGWQQRFTLGPDESMYTVRFDFSGASGWLAKGTPMVSSWNGSSFISPQQNLATLRAFVAPPGLNRQDPVAVFGDGVFARRAGSTWQFTATPTLSSGSALSVNSTYGLAGGDAWLLGNAIARYDAAAQTITPLVTPVSGEFLAIDGSDATTLWAVGNYRKVLRFDGQQWVPPSVIPPEVVEGPSGGDPLTLTSLEFTAVDVRSANDVVLLGNDPAGGRFVSVFYRWDGVSWSTTRTDGVTLSKFDRDTQGNFYVVEGASVKKRAPSATTWTTVGTASGTITRLRVYGPDEIELVVRTDAGLGLFLWDADRQSFSLKGGLLDLPGALDIVPGAPLQSGRATFWSVGALGAVLRFESPN